MMNLQGFVKKQKGIFTIEKKTLKKKRNEEKNS